MTSDARRHCTAKFGAMVPMLASEDGLIRYEVAGYSEHGRVARLAIFKEVDGQWVMVGARSARAEFLRTLRRI